MLPVVPKCVSYVLFFPSPGHTPGTRAAFDFLSGLISLEQVPLAFPSFITFIFKSIILFCILFHILN